MDEADSTAFSPPSSNTCNLSSTPTQAEWEHQRATITQLYSVDKEPLKKVRAIMAENYGFQASERMFKGRLRLWNVRKNCTSKELIRTIKIMRDRAEIGKETAVRIRGLEVNATKLRKFRNRKRQADEELLKSAGSRSATPSDVSCFTPRLDPVTVHDDGQEVSSRTNTSTCMVEDVPRFLLSHTDTAPETTQAPPHCHGNSPECSYHLALREVTDDGMHPSVNPGLWEVFAAVPLSNLAHPQTLVWDEMFSNMKCYYESYFHSPAWIPHSTQPVNFEGDEIQIDPCNNYLGTIEANNAIFDFTNPSALVTLYEAACLLFQRQDAKEAHRFIRQAFDLIEVLLKDEHPQLLGCLFLVVCILEASERIDLVEQLLDFTSWKSTAIHGAFHPIPRIISCCSRTAAPCNSSAPHALRGTVVTFERLIGQHHTFTLRLKQIYAWSLFQRGRFGAALNELQKLRHVYETLAGEDHINSRHVLFVIAQIYTAQGKLSEAEVTFQKVYQLSEQRYVMKDPPSMINLECLRMLAVVYRRQEKIEEVVPMLCKALPVGIKLLGREHPTVLLIGHDLKKMSM